jgi:hypothetical protein
MSLVKKVLLILLLGFFMNTSLCSVAHADDYWCYTDKAGIEYYAVMEKTEYVVGGQIIGYVKQVLPGKSVNNLEWIFAFDEGVCWAYCKTNPSLTPIDRKARNSPLSLSIIRCLYHHKYGDSYNSYID